jgi:hypothetical protein
MRWPLQISQVMRAILEIMAFASLEERKTTVGHDDGFLVLPRS